MKKHIHLLTPPHTSTLDTRKHFRELSDRILFSDDEYAPPSDQNRQHALRRYFRHSGSPRLCGHCQDQLQGQRVSVRSRVSSNILTITYRMCAPAIGSLENMYRKLHPTQVARLLLTTLSGDAVRLDPDNVYHNGRECLMARNPAIQY